MFFYSYFIVISQGYYFIEYNFRKSDDEKIGWKNKNNICNKINYFFIRSIERRLFRLNLKGQI